MHDPPPDISLVDQPALPSDVYQWQQMKGKYFLSDTFFFSLTTEQMYHDFESRK